jgi:hypothetical protein
MFYSVFLVGTGQSNTKCEVMVKKESRKMEKSGLIECGRVVGLIKE